MSDKRQTKNKSPKNIQEDNRGGRPPSGGKKPFQKPDMPDIKKPKGINWLYIGLLLFFGYLLYQNNYSEHNPHEISLSQFQQYLWESAIDSVVIFDQKRIATAFVKRELAEQDPEHAAADTGGMFGQKVKTPYYLFRFGDLQLFQEELDKAKKEGKLVSYRLEATSDWMMILGNVLPFVFLLAIWFYIMRRMSGAGGGGGAQIFSIGKSRAKLFDPNQKVKITFKDVAGLEEAKMEMAEIVDFLKNPKKYTALGGKTPKGALLVGPPGTGKTLLAKAVAGEANVPFFSLSGSDFVEMFVGVGASRVRDLFKQAKQKAPSIIFIDEIDAIGRARGRNNLTGNDERENTLNQLLTEMDGFGTDTNVIVIAATNRADILDKALLRAGRFDRQIYVDLPDRQERKEIFKVHMKPLKLAEDVDIDFLSKQTTGFSGADIANVCNEAALIAARKDKKKVFQQDFMDAIDRIVGGLEKKNKIVNDDERRTVAYHEAGHATVSWMTEHAFPLVKVTIVPRGRSLGAAWYLPEERIIVKTDQMLDEMCATLGGRASEEVIFGKISTGALNDLQKVTQQARAMVTIYGLSKKVGNITYYDPQNEMAFTKPYSEKTAELIDKEISRIVEEQYQRALKIIRDNKEKLTVLAEELLKKEVIFQEDLERIFGKRPFAKDDSIEEAEAPSDTENTSGISPEGNTTGGEESDR